LGTERHSLYIKLRGYKFMDLILLEYVNPKGTTSSPLHKEIMKKLDRHCASAYLIALIKDIENG